MVAAVQLRNDYSGDDLRRLARASRDAAQTRRLLALAAIYDDGSRTMAARIGGVGLQIVRDWVLRFNARGPEGLIDRKATGKTPLLSQAQRAALAQAVDRRQRMTPLQLGSSTRTSVGVEPDSAPQISAITAPNEPNAARKAGSGLDASRASAPCIGRHRHAQSRHPAPRAPFFDIRAMLMDADGGAIDHLQVAVIGF
jgi:transposase